MCIVLQCTCLTVTYMSLVHAPHIQVKGCSVQFNKILAKHSLVKIPGHLSFKVILAPENKVSMATNNRLLSFYTLSLKLKLVCHLLFNGHEFFPKLL